MFHDNLHLRIQSLIRKYELSLKKIVFFGKIDFSIKSGSK